MSGMRRSWRTTVSAQHWCRRRKKAAGLTLREGRYEELPDAELYRNDGHPVCQA